MSVPHQQAIRAVVVSVVRGRDSHAGIAQLPAAAAIDEVVLCHPGGGADRFDHRGEGYTGAPGQLPGAARCSSSDGVAPPGAGTTVEPEPASGGEPKVPAG